MKHFKDKLLNFEKEKFNQHKKRCISFSITWFCLWKQHLWSEQNCFNQIVL